MAMYYTRSQATQQELVREHDKTHGEQKETCEEQDESHKEQGETHGGQDETFGEQKQGELEAHGEQDERFGEQKQGELEAHGEQDETFGEQGQGESHGEQDELHREQKELESELHKLYQKELLQGSSQELHHVTTRMSDPPQEILLLRPCNPTSRYLARRGRPKGSINRRRRRGSYKTRFYQTL